MPPKDAQDEPLLDDKPVQRGRGCSMFVVYFAVFVDMLGFGLVLPAMPQIAQYQFKATDLDIGIMTAAYSIAQMIGNVLCGVWSDKIGRRPILTGCLFGSGLSLSGMALLTKYEPNLYSFIALRAAGGVMSATVGIAQAYIADCARRNERTKFMGLVGAASGFGVVAGPVLGPLLSTAYGKAYGTGPDGKNVDGFVFICVVGAGISFTNFILAMIFLREVPHLTIKHKKAKDGIGVLWTKAMAVMKKDCNLLIVFLAFMLAQFGFTTFQTLFVLYVSPPPSHGKYHFTQQKIGLVFMGFGLSMIIVQMLLTAPLSKYLGDKWTTIIGSAIRGLGLGFLPFVDPNNGAEPTHDAWLIVCVMAIGMSGSLVNPCLSAIVANFSDKHTQGTILGVNQMFGSFARAVAPIVAAWLYSIDQTAAWVYFGGVSCGLCCVVMLPLRIPEHAGGKSSIRSMVNPTNVDEDPDMDKQAIYPYGEGPAPQADPYLAIEDETDTEDTSMATAPPEWTHERPPSPPHEDVE